MEHADWLLSLIDQRVIKSEGDCVVMSYLLADGACRSQASKSRASRDGEKSERKNERRSKLSAFRRVLRPKHPNHLSRNKNTKIFLVSSLKQLGSSPRWREKK